MHVWFASDLGAAGTGRSCAGNACGRDGYCCEDSPLEGGRFELPVPRGEGFVLGQRKVAGVPARLRRRVTVIEFGVTRH